MHDIIRTRYLINEQSNCLSQNRILNQRSKESSPSLDSAKKLRGRSWWVKSLEESEVTHVVQLVKNPVQYIQRRQKRLLLCFFLSDSIFPWSTRGWRLEPAKYICRFQFNTVSFGLVCPLSGKITLSRFLPLRTPTCPSIIVRKSLPELSYKRGISDPSLVLYARVQVSHPTWS